MDTFDNLIAGYSLTEAGEEWEEIFAAFRALGGIADNIRPGRGRFGRGLYPIEPSQPFRLYVPENLMIPIEDIAFVGERIGIRESAGVPRPERRFFELYANSLSWGGGGRQESTTLVSAFDTLPNNVRTLLASDFGMGPWFDGEPAARIQLRFLQSRAFEFHGRHMLIPLLELADHDSQGLAWNVDQGAEIAGQASGEIRTSYGLPDPFSLFHRFAFAGNEPVAFSLPMKLNIGPIDLAIERNFEMAQLRGALVPKLVDTGTGFALSFLMLGHRKRPKLPRGTFRALMEPFGLKNVDEEFDRILHANWTKFLKLLGALEAHRGDLIVSLRNMALYQLEAMSSCVGARQL